jgi:drug/metabolite transporter (DMT)-like permease
LSVYLYSQHISSDWYASFDVKLALSIYLYTWYNYTIVERKVKMLSGGLYNKLRKLEGQIYLFLAFTLAGTSVISAKYISGKIGVFTIASVSLFFALLLLLPICWKNLSSEIRAMTAKKLFTVILQAVFGIFLSRIFLLNGLKHTGSAEAGVLTGTTPAITTILAMVFLKERINTKIFVGIISTILGILIIQGFLNNSFNPEHLIGNLIILCASASDSAFNILSRKSVVKNESEYKKEINPIVQTALVSFIAFIFCLIPAAFESPVQKLSAIGLTEWLMLLWYGIIITALAYIFWYAGIKRCGAMTAATYSGMMPFTSMLLSVILLGESTGWRQWSGGFLIISGMVMIGSDNKQ